MFTNKTILSPTDFHEKAQKAQEYALEAAARTQSDLHFLHAVEEPYDFATRVEETVEACMEAAEERFEEILEAVRQDERYKKIETDYLIKRGRPYSTIMGTAHELNADLIVMGT
ncbi:MAG: universal stress protein, partial [Balneolaceae bacterium]|nr:universal stress protein [Balneolaceae bacterium]